MHSVLIIENDHDTRVSLRRALEDEGYFVFSTANGFDGLSVLARIKRPSIILLDQNMPLMSGDEFITLKNRDQNLASIPVIVVSAVQNRCGDSAVAFLAKPVNLEGLLSSVRRVCSAQNTQSGLTTEVESPRPADDTDASGAQN